MEYKLENQSDGAVSVVGTLYQENAPEHWFMPLPVVFAFDGDRRARGTLQALGPSTPFAIKLPMRPKKVELDPEHWVLSEETTSRKSK